jgi:penicillin-binding protein 2
VRGSGFDPVSVEIFNRRFKVVTFFLVLVVSALIFRLWFLQILKGQEYRIHSENNRIHLIDIPPARGMIFDRNGELLVDNRPSYDLYIIPEEIQDRKQLLDRISALIGIHPDSVAEKLGKTSRIYTFKPILIKEALTRDEVALVESNLFHLSGAMIQVRPTRYYVHGNFASHIIGYLGEISARELGSGRFAENKAGDFIGKYGTEGRWQSLLNGQRGGEQVERDAAGRKLRVLTKKAPIPGANISLSIIKRIQTIAEESLEGQRGAIVAMDPETGEILALASRPSFDPNAFIRGLDRADWARLNSSKESPLQNRAIAGQYPPGSIFKIVVALAGLQEGLIDPTVEVPCHGHYRLGNRTYRCWKKWGHGKVAFYEALKQSCDVYFYTVGRKLGVDTIARYARMCNLGEKTGFDLGSEMSGLVPDRNWKQRRWGAPWQAGETISLSIGQSFLLVTALQTTRLIGAVFNGGVFFKPKVVRRIEGPEGTIYAFTPEETGRIDADPTHMAHIRRALIGVVNDKKGTGSQAKVEGIKVAGKTGTAQVVSLNPDSEALKEDEIPYEQRDHAWFVAVAPADQNPRIALSIIVEHGGHGGSAAAPIAQKIIRAYLKGE